MEFLWSERFWLPSGIRWNDMPPSHALSIGAESVAIAIVLVAIRHLLNQRVLRPYALYRGVTPGPLGEVEGAMRGRQLAEEEGIRRFCESVWRGFMYSCLVVYGVLVLRGEQWFMESDGWLKVRPYRQWPTGEQLSSAIRHYYAVQVAHNLAMLVDHVRGDVRLSDHNVMLTHHIIAVIVQGVFVALNSYHVALLGMLATDLAVPFADFGKAFNYARYPNATFAILAFLFPAWILGRLIAYPYYVVYSTFEVVVFNGGASPAMIACLLLLSVICYMQLYWTVLMYRSSLRLFQKRSDMVAATKKKR